MLNAEIIKPSTTPFLKGIALDRPGSLRDQLVSVEFLGGGQSRLYYSLYNPQPDNTLNSLIPSELVHYAQSTHSEKKSIVTRQFKELTEAVTERNKDALFDTETYKPALTFCFDIENAETVGCSVFSSRAKISGFEDYKHANKLLKHSPHAKELSLWKRVVLNEINKGRKEPKKDIGFEHVVQATTLNIQNIAHTMSGNEGIECLHRRQTPSSKPNDPYLYVPSSTASQPKTQKYDWTVPLTTRSNVISGINNMVFYSFCETKDNILTPEQAHALSVLSNPPRNRVANKSNYMTQFFK